VSDITVAILLEDARRAIGGTEYSTAFAGYRNG
jgi:hypothetical protein